MMIYLLVFLTIISAELHAVQCYCEEQLVWSVEK